MMRSGLVPMVGVSRGMIFSPLLGKAGINTHNVICTAAVEVSGGL